MLTPSPFVQSKVSLRPARAPRFALERTLHWMGGVTNESYSRITGTIKELLRENQNEPITLMVTSPGGPTGVAMSFYDLMKNVYRPKLQTVGSGDVDSAGIILFLTGAKRYLTPHTTMLLHLAGRTFESCRRFSTADMASILKEDTLKDQHYASVVAECSGGRLTQERVLELMAANTVLTAEEAVRYGLAQQII